MKQFLAFVQKEFYHIFRDKRTILILLGMPVVEIILFGFAITTEVNNIRVAILDPSNDPVTTKIIERFDENPYFIVTKRLRTSSDIEKVFQKGETDLILAFSDNFDANVYRTKEASIQLIVDATDPNTASMLTNYAKNILASVADASQNHIEIKLLYNPQMKSAYNFVPGVMGLILMLICAMMTSISIVREKETGTMEVLLVSPIRPIFIIVAKAVPYFVLSCVNLVTILLLSVYVLHVPIAGNLFWLSMLSVIFILVALALGLLISTIATTQVAAMLISGMAMMMPVMLLSGMIFPIESMPAPLQWISNIIPAKWYIIAVKKIMIEGLDISFAWKESAILLLMGIFIVAVSLKKFSKRLSTNN